MTLANTYRSLDLYVYVSDVHPDLQGAIGVLLSRKQGWENSEFVIDGSTVVMVKPERDLRPLSWKDRVK